MGSRLLMKTRSQEKRGAQDSTAHTRPSPRPLAGIHTMGRPSGNELMPRLQFLIATLLAAPLALPAQATQQDCSEALRRPQVEAFFARGDYEGAIAQLEQVQHRQDACRPDTLDANWYWLRSDLSLAYLKAGREQDCINLLGRLIDNPASSQDIQQHLEQDGRIHRALRTNQRLCHAAHEARLEVYRATPCPQPVDGELASVAISSDRCLALLPATEAE